jgi:hypothetical protein
MPEEYQEIVEEVVSIFDALSNERSPYGGSERDGFVADLEELSPEELASQLRRAEHIVEAFCTAAETINPVTHTALSDARNRLMRARAALEA